MRPLKELLSFYFVMGSPNCIQNPRKVLREAIQGGVTFFQFREKGVHCLGDKEMRELAIDLQVICQEFSIPFIINDNVQLAIELDADGVHIGQEDKPIEDVRKLIGNKILGVSAHNIEEAEMAIEKGADYLGVGPMYATHTKADTQEIQGPNLIRNMRKAGIGIPIVGIGGISESNVEAVISNGADGIAVITAISQSSSPQIAAHHLKGKIK